MVSDKL